MHATLGTANFQRRLQDLAPHTNDLPTLGFVRYQIVDAPRVIAMLWRQVGFYGNQARWLGNGTRIVDADVERILTGQPPRTSSRVWLCPVPGQHTERSTNPNVLIIPDPDLTGRLEVIEVGCTHRFLHNEVGTLLTRHTCELCRYSFDIDRGD